VKGHSWPRTEIDRFVLVRLEQHELTPSIMAAPRTRLRRLHYDLTGLPPSADDVAKFQRNPDAAQYTAIVETLLSSSHFGERWGRYWLDVARYSDTKGYVFREDRNYPQAYTYRDWVIQALNDDMPYDQFLIAQLAADQLDDPSAAPAMGFLTLGRRFINNKHDIIDDRIDVVCRGLLGLTATCARCQVRSDSHVGLLRAVRRICQFSGTQRSVKAAADGGRREAGRAGCVHSRQPGQPRAARASPISDMCERTGLQAVPAGKRTRRNGSSDCQRGESAYGTRVG
jgi:hypothetical protein